MLYVKKGQPKIAVSQQIAQIKRGSDWKAMPLTPPEDKDGAKKYTDNLRLMFDRIDKADLRETILKEQHGLCVYCMRPISNDKHTKIEHWYPLSQSKEKALDYSNFYCACAGKYSADSKTFSCCDEKKDNSIIELNPGNRAMMEQIRYKTHGEIYFEASPAWTEDQVSGFQRELNEVLKLNGKVEAAGTGSGNDADFTGSGELVSKRAAVLHGCKQTLDRLRRKNPGFRLSVQEVQRLVDQIESKEQFPEYAGVKLFYYKRWIRNHA